MATPKTTAAPKKPANVAPATLTAWRTRMGYSQRDAVRALGCSREAWGNWEGGKHAIPRYIGLACAALALGMSAYGDGRDNGDGQ